MGKAPAFQFYPGDWMQDTRVLSLAAKGVWIDLLCAMWRSQTRGKLSLPWIGYARLVGASVEQTKAAINELIDMQICDYEADGNADCNGNVTLINRRMHREERERELTRYRVERHRNADKKRSCNADSNAKVTPPSSSSTSSSCTKVHKDIFVLPEWIPQETWDAYLEVRKKKRAAKTVYALNLVIRELEKLRDTHNHDPVVVLNKSIKSGWVDVYPLKDVGQGNNGSKSLGKKLKKVSELPDLDKDWEERSRQEAPCT